MLRRRLAAERGTTLIELLVAMAVGGIVLAGVVTVFTGTLRSDARTEDRVRSTAMARNGVEAVLTALNAQVCADAVTPPIMTSSTGSQVNYYADTPTPAATGTQVADGAHAERLAYDASARTIVRSIWSGTSQSGSPTRQRTLATNVDAGASTGPFSYFGATTTDPSAPPTALPSTGLTTTQAASVLRVRVDLVARTQRTNAQDGRSTVLGGDAYVQSLDPLQPQLGARCNAL